MDTESWSRLTHLAERRHGVVRRDDLIAAGISPRQVDRWLAAGRLVALERGTYRMAGAPPTFEAVVQAAVLAYPGDAYASHHTAARLWGIPVAGRDGRIELTRPTVLSATRAGLLVHRSTRLPDHHVTAKGLVPLTTPARTLFDLARVTGDRRFDRAIEATLRARLCTVGALHRVLAELGGRGRPGTRRMRNALERRDGDYVPTASELEAVARAVLDGIDGLRWHVALSDRQGFIGEVDIVIDAAQVVLELDGHRFHAQPSDEVHDAQRDARLLALGYVVRRLTWFDVTRRPDVVRADVLRMTRDAVA